MTKPKPKAAKPAPLPKNQNPRTTQRKAPAAPTPPPRKPAAKPKGLTPKQQRFVEEYTVDSNGTQAAIRAGYSRKTAEVIANQLLKKPWVALAVTNARKAVTKRVETDADIAYLQAFRIATADAREIVQVRRIACDRCWEDDDADPEDIWARRDPNPKCPRCKGEGHSFVELADTRKLSPAAAALYAGAKMGKHGIEIRMHDKLAALEKVFRFHGLYAKENEQLGAAAAQFAEMHRLVMQRGSKPQAVAAPPNAHAHQ